METTVKVPIASVDIRPEDIEAVGRVLESGKLRQGAVTGEFEERFAERVGAKHAVAVSSGTAALHLAYMALFKRGDEVIVPAFTFMATASMLLAVGVEPVFADVDPRTFTLSVDDVRSRISQRTKGIVGVHLFGNACDVDGLKQVADDHGLTLVWDAAQALGTEYRGQEVGSQPTAVCYSFYPTKNITTGEGGMIVTDNSALADELRLLRSHGASGKYVHVMLGFNYRMTDFQAALGLQQLQRLDYYLERRRSNAAVLTERLAEVRGVISPAVQERAFHSYNQYCILIESEVVEDRRDGFAARLNKLGIETAVHYPRGLNRQPLFAGADGTAPIAHSISMAPLVNSDDIAGRILALPIHPGVSNQAVERVAFACSRAAAGTHS